MKVYVVQIQYRTGSWGDNDSLTIDCVKDTEEKAQARIKELANENLSEVHDGNYPKLIEKVVDCITIANDSYEDEDFTQYFYEEFEVD